jgi:hypothetical protein
VGAVALDPDHLNFDAFVDHGFGLIASFKKTLLRKFSGGCLGEPDSKTSSRLDFTRSVSTPSKSTALTSF